MEVLPFESRYYNRRGAGEIPGGGERNQEREETRRRWLRAGGCVRCVLPFATLLLRLQLIGRMHWPLAACRRGCCSNKCRPRWRFISPAAGVSISVALNGLGMWGQPNHSSLCLYLLRRKPGRIFDYFICLWSTVRLWLIFIVVALTVLSTMAMINFSKLKVTFLPHCGCPYREAIYRLGYKYGIHHLKYGLSYF